jgi:hypothetical protein
VKTTIKRIVDRLRRGGARLHRRVAPSGTSRARDPRSGAAADATGSTIYDDRALRFRAHTVSGVDPRLLDAGGLEEAFKIRLAKLPGATREAGVLVERRYTGRGYRVPAEHRDASLLTFIAYDEGRIVGTVGVRVDSPRGLSASELYPDEIDALRLAGHRVCEFTRLAVDTTIAGKPVLASLFHTAYLYAAILCGCTHAVIEVNPRHASYYKRALRFDAIGPERMNRRVMAPAVLLCASFANIADGIARFAGRRDTRGARNSLFAHAFSRDEAQGVLQRLRALTPQTGHLRG